MTDHEYLLQVLKSQELREQDLKAIHGVRDELFEHLQRHLQPKPQIYYGGSYGKHTMIRDAFDLDIVVYFPHTDTRPLREIFGAVHGALTAGKYIVHPQTVALRLPRYAGFHVDVVPGLAEDASYRYAQLYKRSEPPTTLRTSVKVHINAVRKTGLGPIVRLLKVWRLRQGLKLKSFALEILAARALGYQQQGDFAVAFVTVLRYIKMEIATLELVDPANPANVLAITSEERKAAAEAATRSLNMGWTEVFGVSR